MIPQAESWSIHQNITRIVRNSFVLLIHHTRIFSRIGGTEEHEQVATTWILHGIIMILTKVTVKSQSQRSRGTIEQEKHLETQTSTWPQLICSSRGLCAAQLRAKCATFGGSYCSCFSPFPDFFFVLVYLSFFRLFHFRLLSGVRSMIRFYNMLYYIDSLWWKCCSLVIDLMQTGLVCSIYIICTSM